MKIIRPALIAAAMMLPFAAAAQTSRPDRGVDTDRTGTSDQDSATERASTTGGARTEPNDTSREVNEPREVRPGMPAAGDSAFDRDRQQLRSDVTDLKTEVEDLRANSNEQGRAKIDALSRRVNDLEQRTISASDGSERDFNENKHKYKNELKKIRRELKDARKYRTEAPNATPMDTPSNP